MELIKTKFKGLVIYKKNTYKLYANEHIPPIILNIL